MISSDMANIIAKDAILASLLKAADLLEEASLAFRAANVTILADRYAKAAEEARSFVKEFEES